MGEDAWGEARTRELRWWDPAPGLAAAASMSGLDYLRAIAAGELPPAPIGSHFGMRPTRVEVGEVVFTAEADESAYNPIGVVHGGMVCTLLDSAAACAVHTTLPAGTAYTSLDLTVSYLRPITRDTGPVVARGWVTKPGRRAAFAAADVRDAEGRVLATATSTCLVMGP